VYYDPEKEITIRTKDGFIYKGKAKIYFHWWKHIFEEFEIIS